MKAEYRSVVSRIYGKNIDGELIASFQYSGEAREYAEKLAELTDPDTISAIIVTDFYTGNTFYYSTDTSEEDNE